jgi:gluconate:H+ symporter, GntP family
LGADIGMLILYGFFIAIPAMFAGHWWAVYAGKNTVASTESDEKTDEPETEQPHTLAAFLPVLVPILLMAIKSVISLEKDGGNIITGIFAVIGDPAIALAIGVILAILITRNKKNNLSQHLSQAVEKAGGILIIIGAGGAFGAVLAATNIGGHFSEMLDLKTAGIWFPFLLTSVLKTAQGSSTVAIITASSIVLPLLTALGLDSDNGRLLAALSMGAGSMMISHTNDAYFWVISRFSRIDIKTMLRVHSIASILMGLVTMIFIYILSLFIL